MAKLFENISEGFEFEAWDSIFKVTAILDLKQVLAKNVKTKEVFTFDIAKIKKALQDQNSSKEHLAVSKVSEEHWKEANEKFKIIEPLLKQTKTILDVENAAKKAGVHSATIYRWIEQYESTFSIESLLPNTSSGGRGQSRLTDEQEALIKKVIEEHYINKQRKSVSKVHRELKILCLSADIKVPSDNTLRARIKELDKRTVVNSRYGKQKADEQYKPIIGKYKDAKYPLSVVQIDHTKFDLILVDNEHRLPIGRPWVTVAICVYSRVVVGYYICFESPSSTSLGQCLSHAILPKDTFLSMYGIEADWNVYGLMKAIHVDNAKEFRGDSLMRVCQKYNIRLEWRPVGKANYGGHIERLLGTFNKEVHTLPGSTFSNPKEKGRYDSAAHASMTLSDFEKWFATYVTEVYHQKYHSEIHSSPMEKYEKGILGDSGLMTGLPPIIMDERKLQIDFMPSFYRTVQTTGIQLDKIYYYADSIKHWINAESKNKKKRKFLLKRDPRDISQIYFYDEDIEQYLQVPYRDLSAPSMSIWEYREVRKRLVDQGHENIDESKIFDGYKKMREIVDESKSKTMKQRRRKVQSKMHKRDRTDDKAKLSERYTKFKNEQVNKPKRMSPSLEVSNVEQWDDEIQPFSDVEVY